MLLAIALIAFAVFSGASSPGPALGLFTTSQTPADVDALGVSLGVTPSVVTTYGGGANADQYPTWANGALRFELAVGQVSAATATALGTELVADGQANADIRPMWELNGNWYAWGAGALTPAAQISDWCAAADAFHAVAGSSFTLTWNINAGTGGAQQFAAYPGATCQVDAIGFDHYDTNSGAAADASIVNPVLAFAKTQGKPVEIDEWGLDGADDPAYINYMASVIANPANDVILQSYFNDVGPGNADAQLQDFPASAVAYRADFSGVLPVPTTAVPPTTAPPIATTIPLVPPTTVPVTTPRATTTTRPHGATTTTRPHSPSTTVSPSSTLGTSTTVSPSTTTTPARTEHCYKGPLKHCRWTTQSPNRHCYKHGHRHCTWKG
jgi:hypothetical protein